jgi:hypothetical protein
MTAILAGAVAPVAAGAQTPSARDVRGPSPLVAIPNEPPPRLIVDPPLAEPLSRGRVFIQYRTEHLRVVPVFGAGALDVSPRIGHVHISVDDLPWHFVDASGETGDPGRPAARPAQGAVRAGRPHAPRHHQSVRDVHGAPAGRLTRRPFHRASP